MKDLARLHAQLHCVPTSSWPSNAPVRTVERWLDELRTAAREVSVATIDGQLAWLEANKGDAETDDLRVCHLDFTPLNVLLPWNSEPTVIDWDMAALGDPVSDLGFTLEFFALAPVFLSGFEAIVARVIMSVARRAFLRACLRQATVDRRRLRYWRALYTVLAQLWVGGATVGDISSRAAHHSGDAFPLELAHAAADRFYALTGVPAADHT